MVPDFALRIQSMIRSMREVILPAIAKDQRLALDQANILIGNLKIMAEQQDRIVEYQMAELREFSALTKSLAAAAQGGKETDTALERAKAVLAKVVPVAAMPVPAQSELASLVMTIKQAADELLHASYADGTPAFRKAAAAEVLEQSQKQVLRERVWFRGAGFELDPAKLPSLDDVLR
jgi:hypothetical protein